MFRIESSSLPQHIPDQSTDSAEVHETPVLSLTLDEGGQHDDATDAQHVDNSGDTEDADVPASAVTHASNTDGAGSSEHRASAGSVEGASAGQVELHIPSSAEIAAMSEAQLAREIDAMVDVIRNSTFLTGILLANANTLCADCVCEQGRTRTRCCR